MLCYTMQRQHAVVQHTVLRHSLLSSCVPRGDLGCGYMVGMSGSGGAGVTGNILGRLLLLVTWRKLDL